MTQHPGSGAAAAASPGARLAAAREALGLTVAEVAAQMRISARQVQAIETERYGDLPGAVFVRGFVRNYARLLKLDPTPLLHALEAELGQDVPLRAHEISGALPVHARRSHTRTWFAVLALVVIAVLGAGGYELWQSQSERAPGGAIGGRPEPAPVPASTPAAPAPGASAAAPQDRQETAARTSAEGAGAAPGVPGTPAPEPAPVSASGGARSARLGIEFLRDSWVEVRAADGTVVYSGTGAANSRRDIDAPAPLAVVVGNASGVRITYNGQPFDLAAHATRNIARFSLE